LAKLFGSSSSPEVEKIDVDIDASVFMLGEDGKMIRDGLVYFGQEESKCKSIHHSGDNRTGDGDGDDETITMDLQKVPSYVQKLVVVINIYDCVKNGQSFGMIENSYIRLLDQSKKELVHYDLTENYNGKTAIYVAEIVRNGSEWEFHAVGEATDEASLSDMRRRYL
jgi:stress response protein SCP2